MRDAECIWFLQWALPRLGFRWRGFRKVRRQVCRRISRRFAALGLADIDAYRDYLLAHPDEWALLDGLCRITISRFCRDRGLFEALADAVLPALAQAARARGDRVLQCWSAGCASGEEPYGLAIVWREAVAAAFPDLELVAIATDADAVMLARARVGRYQAGSLKDIPGAWRATAFAPGDTGFTLRDVYRTDVAFERQDIREACPPGLFDLVLCRNMAFTYFDESAQRRILARIHAQMRPGAVLVVGAHETLPPGSEGFSAWDGVAGVYRKDSTPAR